MSGRPGRIGGTGKSANDVQAQEEQSSRQNIQRALHQGHECSDLRLGSYDPVNRTTASASQAPERPFRLVSQYTLRDQSLVIYKQSLSKNDLQSLEKAANTGDLETVKRLYNKEAQQIGFDKNDPSSGINLAFFAAAQSGQLEIMKFLRNNGADLFVTRNKNTRNKKNALERLSDAYRYSRHSDPKRAENLKAALEWLWSETAHALPKLMSEIKDLTGVTDINQNNLSSTIDSIIEKIEKESDKDQVPRYRLEHIQQSLFNLFGLAAVEGRRDRLSQLINLGAHGVSLPIDNHESTTRTSKKITAIQEGLLRAIKNKKPEIVKLLCEKGANIYINDIYSTKYNSYIETLPLWEAFNSENQETVETLLKYKADPEKIAEIRQPEEVSRMLEKYRAASTKGSGLNSLINASKQPIPPQNQHADTLLSDNLKFENITLHTKPQVPNNWGEEERQPSTHCNPVQQWVNSDGKSLYPEEMDENLEHHAKRNVEYPKLSDTI